MKNITNQDNGRQVIKPFYFIKNSHGVWVFNGHFETDVEAIEAVQDARRIFNKTSKLVPGCPVVEIPDCGMFDTMDAGYRQLILKLEFS